MDDENEFREWSRSEDARYRLSMMAKLKQDPTYSKLTKKMKDMLADLEVELCDEAQDKPHKSESPPFDEFY